MSFKSSRKYGGTDETGRRRMIGMDPHAHWKTAVVKWWEAVMTAFPVRASALYPYTIRTSA
jgi:hypothetical protein